jgi:protein-S-isoprenylcysteine O-methyltransferase Ste14
MSAPSSLPFGSGGPLYVVIFWGMFVSWQSSELVLNMQRRSASLEGRDRESFLVLALTFGIAFSLDFASTLFLPTLMIPWTRSVFVVGVCCVLAGTALRRYAVTTLGRYFTVDVTTEASQPVIDAGPYRLIRNPAYAGLLLSLVGFALALGNWAGLVAMLVLPIAAFTYRIAVEEAALLSTLGDPYARYMRRTWRLIPFVL